MEISWKNCLKIGTAIFALYLCIHYWPFVSNLIATLFGASIPLLIGCGIAYLVNILMKFYERYYFSKTNRLFISRSRRPVCMTLAFITLLAIVTLIIWLVVPQLISCFGLIIAELPGVLKMIIHRIDELNILPDDITSILTSIDWKSKIGEIMGVVTSGLGSVMDIVIKTISSVFSWVITVFLSIIFAIYLLTSKEKLGYQSDKVLKRYLPEVWYSKIRAFVVLLDDCFHRYIVGQCTEACILGVLCLAGMLLLRLPYAAMISALIAFTALIPVAGAYIGAVVGAFMILTVSPVKALVFLIFIVALQQFEGNLIYPRVVGSSMGLPAIWVLAAVTLGGGVMGIIGMLLGVPLAAAIYRLLKADVNNCDPLNPMEKQKET